MCTHSGDVSHMTYCSGRSDSGEGSGERWGMRWFRARKIGREVEREHENSGVHSTEKNLTCGTLVLDLSRKKYN